MSNKFHGTIEEFKLIVEKCGYTGTWETKSNGLNQFRASSGEIINWWPSNGTIQYQGKNIDQCRSMLTTAMTSNTDTTSISPNLKLDSKPTIFIVHGHDREAREQLELILLKLGLEPFILQNADSGSKTIVEALETRIYQDCALGVILLTPDDYGYAQTKTETDRQPRARQNVILEMGMVMASLGRERMLVLKKGALEMPSDAAGIQYHEFNTHVREVVPKLVQRLQQLGFELDSKKVAAASS